ncbi:hypothetical protein B0T14DRAFT_580152 [Immersiella caudata]|uniref:Uncharacterized protein n=1 Tax=Immersiella caudata TaxID=314043 RepID=A0AA40C7B2_9PEZI|nr:hypothetical protein B0T14DRAFT_580152 [Immersiella caudata]
MVHASFIFLAALAPLALADSPEAGWGPGGGGHGPPRGPGGPPPWAPGRPGGPWQTAAPNQAPQDLGCTARPACDSASAAARSCEGRAAATGGAVYNDCLCQAGPSAAIRDCYVGCFGSGGPQWLAQCVAATAPATTRATASGTGSVSRTGTGTGGGGPASTTRPSGSGPAPTGTGASGTRTGGPGPSGNGTVPSRTSGLGGSGGPSLPPTATPVRSGASSQIIGGIVTSVVGFVLAAQLALMW